MPEEFEPDSKRRLIYVGRRENKGRLYPGYQYEDEDAITRDTYVHSKPVIAGVPIGTIIELTLTGEGTSWWAGGPKRPRIVGAYQGQDITAWRANDVALSQTYAIEARAKKKLSDDPAQDAIEELRKAIRTLPNTRQKAAYVAYINAYILS